MCTYSQTYTYTHTETYSYTVHIHMYTYTYSIPIPIPIPGSCSAGSDTPQDFVLRGIRPRWQIKTPQNQTKMFLELAILFKGTLFENRLYV